MTHLQQLLVILAIGVAFAALLWRSEPKHPVDCICERCRRHATDRYIDQLLAERERRDRAGQVVRLDDFRWRRHG